MTKINHEAINKKVAQITKIMLDRKDTIGKGNIYVLDLANGFLFYNTSKGWLYEGMCLVSEPNYLTGEVKRTAQVINYTTGKTSKGNYILHKDSGIEDLEKIYKQIINC